MRLRTGWPTEVLVLAALTGVVAAGYWATRPPLYNPASTIDPWLYTAMFVNFDQIYAAFAETYYATRLPLIVPGYVLNLFFDPTTAYFLLHGAFFLAGGVFVYLLVRSWFGPGPAAAAYAWLTGCQMYLAAHRWDYWDGTIITYLAAALFFGLSPPPRPRLRFVWLGLAGFFVAAAVVTNLFVLAFALPLPLLYATVTWPGSVSALIRRAAADVAAFLGGAALLYLGCALFAVANDARFWFIGPQISAARIIDSDAYKQDYGDWVPHEPRIIVPIVLVAILATLILFGASDRGPARRAALGACLYLGSLCLVLGFHELALGGYFVEYLYYFNPLLPAMALCFGAICFLLARDLPHWVGIGTAVATLLAVEVVLLYIYWDDDLDRVGRPAYVVAATLFGLGAIAVATRSLLSRPLFPANAAALLAVLMLAGGSAYAFDGSADTYERGDTGSAGISADTFRVSQRIVSYLTNELGGGRLPAFWYDDSAEGGAHVGIQSMYYYSYTYLGLDLPKLNSDFKARLSQFNPSAIVLLCSRPSCEGGPEALRRERIPITLRSGRGFAHGDLKVWVRIFDLAKA